MSDPARLEARCYKVLQTQNDHTYWIEFQWRNPLPKWYVVLRRGDTTCWHRLFDAGHETPEDALALLQEYLDSKWPRATDKQDGALHTTQ